MAPRRSKSRSPKTPSPPARSPKTRTPKTRPSKSTSPEPHATPLGEKYARRNDWRDFYRWERNHVSNHGRVQKLHERWALMPNKQQYVKTTRLLEEWQTTISNWNRRIIEAEATDANLARRHYLETQKRRTLERLEWRLKKFIDIYETPIPQLGKLKAKYAEKMLSETEGEIAAIHQTRAAGRVRCRGHDPNTWTGSDANPERLQDREALQQEWREYAGKFVSLYDAPESWVLDAAIDRATILFDHSGVVLYPPEISDEESPDDDVRKLVECLDKLREEEERAYKTLPIYWEPVETAVRDAVASSKLNVPTQGVGAAMPALKLTGPEYEETPNTVEPSARALRHLWEGRVRASLENPKQAAHSMFYYHLALRGFDSCERKWVVDEEDLDE